MLQDSCFEGARNVSLGETDNHDTGGGVSTSLPPVGLAHACDFSLGPVSVRPSRRTLRGPAGEVTLEPKVMQVLVALGSSGGALLSRDDLIDRCWDGRAVGDTSINRVISLVRKGLVDVGADGVTLENVPKVGYHLEVKADPEDEAEPIAPASDSFASSLVSPKALAWVGALALAVIAAIGLWFTQPSPRAETQRLRIAVLPLDMADSVDPLFGRGFETELRTALAQIGDVEVFNSDSARTLAQEGLSDTEIAERLDADMVWRGSLTSLSDSVLVEASIIDAQNGRALGAFEVSSDPDAAQYMPLRLARSTARSINRPLANDISEAQLPDSRYSLFLSALGIVASRDMEKILIAEDILRDYLADHPDFAFGQMVLGKAMLFSLGARGEDLVKARFEEGLEYVARAYELDPDNPQIMAARGYWSPKEAKDRVALLEASIAKDPGNVESLIFYGEVLRMDGRTADAVDVYARIIRIDPLWAESRIAIDEALDLGMKEKARGFAEQIGRASTKPWRDLLVQSDFARIEGDFSEAIRLSERALILAPSDLRPDTRRRIAALRYHIGAPDPAAQDRGWRRDLLAGEVGSLADLEALGLYNRVFFQAPDMIEMATPLLVQQGRSEDLVRIYDANDMPVEKFNWGLAEINGELRDVAPYVVIALRGAGRTEEAEKILKAALASDAKFAARTPDGTGELYDRARLLAVAGQPEGALEALEAALTLGLPGTINPLKEPMLIGPMADDPAFAALLDNPRFARIAQTVDAQREKEREETFAAGV